MPQIPLGTENSHSLDFMNNWNETCKAAGEEWLMSWEKREVLLKGGQ